MRDMLRVAAILLCFCVGHAQSHTALKLDPVHWSAEASLPRVIPPGSRFTVLLHASIDPGWHLYALPEPNAFPLATEIALAKTDAADLLQVSQGKPQRSLDPESHIVTAWFAQSAVFTLRLATTSNRVPSDLQVLVRYQACNERMCLPPKDEAVPVRLLSTS